ncbi:ABC transporter ATP-binding protein [Enterococcus columbae]|uniref:Putative hemin import ATP-binding protein HrtA n=1 Tax=Enterococcus columbae DSM 7374 = ATCC 51263 TaxID=1121865 RepID=S1NIH0_9ENTE|nr:ABC transporter ATP-binding protein [Enterococcus columbae]EOT39071.1 ABC transporter ATP-binding protein [Enterococcus columbae DSM 7374 = ATCC 51263]EOW79996.1 ABC transporter ATP-binding protein [Enterococcus columbae DSM 7374 = ATCC 51263]OJG23975.1 ABC transporter ATP-binding protein [Enterococcus columbae DSM 7374 = ATCC 51263]
MRAIEFIHVNKEYKDGSQMIEALKPTDLVINQGEFVAIIGPSGSGKSTFLTLAGGLLQPSNGKILVNQQPFSEENEKKRAKLRFESIGFILQTSNLVPFLTIKDQLRLVDKINQQANPALMDELFTQLGLSHLANKYPENLSGGERQRVAIARALYNNPTIILADEPTASLDSKRAFEVVEILAKETKEKNKATIMVTHDIRMVDYCDRVFQMKDGQLTEQVTK